MLRLIVPALSAAVLLLAPPAMAQADDTDDWDGGYDDVAEYRSDFVAGLGAGLAFGSTG